MDSSEQSSSQNKRPKTLLRRKNIKMLEVAKNSYFIKHQKPSTSIPQGCQQSESPRNLFIRNIFCFRQVKSLVRNDQFICLKLKQTHKYRYALTSHLNRFSNSKVESYNIFGKFLKLFDEKMTEKFERHSRTSLIEAQNFYQMELKQALSTVKGRKYACFYYGPTANVLSLTRILLSNELLTSLGYDPRQFCDDFLKYKHLFFEIFEMSLFYSMMTAFSSNLEEFGGILELLQQSPLVANMDSETLAKRSVVFDDFIYRLVKKNDVLLQQKLKARFWVSKPRINIALVVLDQMDETNIISSEQKKLNNLKSELIKNQFTLLEDDMEFMKKLMHSTVISEQGQSQNPMLIQSAP